MDQFDWQQACLEREHAHKVWTNIDDYLEHFTYNAGLFASVDAVHLMQVWQQNNPIPVLYHNVTNLSHINIYT